MTIEKTASQLEFDLILITGQLKALDVMKKTIDKEWNDVENQKNKIMKEINDRGIIIDTKK